VVDLIRCDYVKPMQGYDEAYGLILDYADLGDLQTFVKKNSQLTQMQIYQIAYGIARGLKALHEQKIVHSDIQLKNIFVRTFL
jgi:serine/threonine protein kinase